MTLTRSITWNVLRHILHDVKQLRHMASAASLYEEKGTWVQLMKRENMLEVERIWKERIQAENENRYLSKTETEDQQKFYVLSMFPYPSGQLHMGHVRVYTISDTMARYHRMLGHEVIHPMGWDAFGLPAENAAKERNLHPKDWTYRNISSMKKQLMNLGCSFDWDREVTTCDPSYYKWTQYIFLKMYEAGLTYQKHASVNWDPIDETVLADEQIDEEGRSWRSGAVAEKRYLKQWYIKTTAYAKALYDGLDTVNEEFWEGVITLQKHWIGQCTGCRLEFTVQNAGVDLEENLSVFTETPECVYGISHIVIDASHRFNKPEYHKLVKKHPITGKDVILLNLQAVHPISGQLLPLVVSEIKQDHDVMRKVNYSLGIPCVSEEDKLTAELFDLSWQSVIISEGETEKMVNSEQFDGLERQEAKKTVIDFARESGFGGYPTSKYLGDWLISRQRYWGTPIPIIHCDTCKSVPVPYEDLPVVLPDDIDMSDTKGGNPLQHHEEWINVKCPRCGGNARRETDTMDTFVDSSWYFLRYLDSQNQTEPVSHSLANRYMPVDLYIGGKEHAHLHLYFARFFNYFLCDIGVLDHKEPFVDLLTQGMVKGESYRIKKTGQYIAPSEVEKIDKKYVQKGTNEPLEVKYEKMSKSKLNGVDPEELFQKYGVDLTRLCILSGVAPKTDRNWNLDAYEGIERWVNRVWYVTGVLVNREQVTKTASDEDMETWNQKIRKLRNAYLIEINQQINSDFILNVVISRLQELTTDLRKVPAEVAVKSVEYERAIVDIALIMAPLAPMFTSEIWHALSKVVVNRELYDFSKSVHSQKWPTVDPDTDVPIAVRCNGKRIGYVHVKHCDIDTITVDSVFDLARKSTFYPDVIKDSPIARTSLRTSGLFALEMSVPGVKVETKSDEKKNKKKEKKKEKKDLQTESV